MRSSFGEEIRAGNSKKENAGLKREARRVLPVEFTAVQLKPRVLEQSWNVNDRKKEKES